MYRVIVHASISRRTTFVAPSAASLRTGEYVLIYPEADERAPEALLVLIDSIRTEHGDAGSADVSVGMLSVLASVAHGEIAKPPTKLPYFRGNIERLPAAVAAAFFGDVETQRDPVTQEIIRPSSLRIGTLLTDDDVPVALSAAGLNRHTVMLAQSGSGKSYGLGVMLEEILTKTRLRVIVIDPNSDFTALAAALPTLPGGALVAAHTKAIIVTADEAGVPFELTPQQAHATLTLVQFESARAEDIGPPASRVLRALWESRGDHVPSLIVIDEAHNLAPSEGSLADDCLSTLIRIAGEGRKYGLWLLLVSQRPQKLHPNLISQCDNLILMRITSAVDLHHVTSAFAGVSQDLMQLASGFMKGEALAAGQIVRTATLFRFRRRLSPESGGDLSLAWSVGP